MNKKGRLYQKGRLCFRFLLAAAVVAAALYSCSAFAARYSAAPTIFSPNSAFWQHKGAVIGSMVVMPL